MKTVSAELLKLKGTYIYFLPLAVVLLSCAIAGLAVALDAHFSVRIGENPWLKLTHGGLVIFTMMLYVPFLILFISAVYYVEQRANAWKLLFVQPVNRSAQFFDKLLVLLGVVFVTSFSMLIGLVIAGGVVDFLMPEFGFSYESPEWGKMWLILRHTAIAGLGILGIQQLMSLRFKHVLVAPGIGIVLFILAMVLAATGSRFTLYVPYTYPIIVPDLETFPFEYQTYPFLGISNTELYSIAWFILSVGIGYVFTRNRSVV